MIKTIAFFCVFSSQHVFSLRRLKYLLKKNHFRDVFFCVDQINYEFLHYFVFELIRERKKWTFVTFLFFCFCVFNFENLTLKNWFQFVFFLKTWMIFDVVIFCDDSIANDKTNENFVVVFTKINSLFKIFIEINDWLINFVFSTNIKWRSQNVKSCDLWFENNLNAELNLIENNKSFFFEISEMKIKFRFFLKTTISFSNTTFFCFNNFFVFVDFFTSSLTLRSWISRFLISYFFLFLLILIV